MAQRRKRQPQSWRPSASSTANLRSPKVRRSSCSLWSRACAEKSRRSPVSRSTPTISSKRGLRSTTQEPMRPSRSRLPPGPRKPEAAPSDSGGMSLYESLYETALKQGLPKLIIDLLARIFSNDVDFQRATSPGDSIEAFYSDPDDIDPRPELLYATISVHDQTFKYYRFQAPDDNSVDYYDENGRSSRKFLLRKPIAEGEITSPFGMRFHPILGLRPHAHRRRLGRADRHADLCRGQRGRHQGGMGIRLRTPGRDPARQRIRDHVQSHVRLRPQRR